MVAIAERQVTEDGEVLRSLPGRGIQIPEKAAFLGDDGKADFIDAPDLAAIGRELVRDCPEFEHLDGLEIVYLWKRVGGESGGQVVVGKCQKTSGLVRYFAQVPWLVWVAADHARDFGFGAREVEALVHHELCHAGADEDGLPTARGHDFDGFTANVRRYGLWHDQLRLARNAFEQLPLPQII